MEIYLVEEETRTQIQSGHLFESENDELKCAEFNPPLLLGETMVHWVYLSSFQLEGQIVNIFPSNNHLRISESCSSLEIKIVCPSTLSFSSCFVIIFYFYRIRVDSK